MIDTGDGADAAIARLAFRSRLHPLRSSADARLEGKLLADMEALDEAGCVGFTNALAPMLDTQVLRRALEYAATLDLTVFLPPRTRGSKARAACTKAKSARA